jgi:hypothetical protein
MLYSKANMAGEIMVAIGAKSTEEKMLKSTTARTKFVASASKGRMLVSSIIGNITHNLYRVSKVSSWYRSFPRSC